jgi:hypothetical protein
LSSKNGEWRQYAATEEAGAGGIIEARWTRPAFRGSKRNGVESHDRGAYDVSFRLQR